MRVHALFGVWQVDSFLPYPEGIGQAELGLGLR